MSNFMQYLISQSFISTDIVDISNIFSSQEPTFRCTCLMKENLGVFFEEFDSTELSRVLLRMIGLCKWISHELFPIDLSCPYTLLNLWIVMAEDVGYAFTANENILVSFRHLTLWLHAIHSYNVGVYAIEDLGACGSPECTSIGKVNKWKSVLCRCLLSTFRNVCYINKNLT